MSSSNDQWVEYFHHQSMEGVDVASSIAFSDSMITTTVTTPSNSSTTTSDHLLHHLSPKGCGSKQVRRRSRASKKTPITLLNANTTNFRALVQQFTGCPSTAFSFESSIKGPVNLSFDQQQNQRNAASVTAAFGNNNHFCDQQKYQPEKHFQQQELHHQQQANKDKQSLVSFDYDSVTRGSDDGFFKNPRSGNYLEIPDGFDMDEISMHEITAASAFF